MAQATYLEAIRQEVLRFGVFLLCAAASLPLQAQKIGEQDLTKDAPATTAKSPAVAECQDGGGGFSHADGYVVPQADRPKLELQVVSLSNLKPALGTTVEAEITLKNIDRADIVIPWAIDPNVANRPLQATHHEFESASFWIWLKDGSGNEELLKSLSLPLYSSGVQPQSALRLSFGQWVTMHIKFRLLVDQESPSHSLASGPAELRIQWRQGLYTWDRKACAFESGYFNYSTFYEQVTNPVKISLVSSNDEEAR